MAKFQPIFLRHAGEAERKTCSGKVGYESRAAAENAASNRPVRLTSYRCQVCGKHHLTKGES